MRRRERGWQAQRASHLHSFHASSHQQCTRKDSAKSVHRVTDSLLTKSNLCAHARPDRYDTLSGADLTTMEEGHEMIARHASLHYMCFWCATAPSIMQQSMPSCPRLPACKLHRPASCASEPPC